MSFSADISGFNIKTQEAANKVFRGSALEIFKSVILRTPVKTGRLRANWQAEINTIPEGEVEGSPRQALAKLPQAIRSVTTGDVMYLVNNLPYAAKIEGGSSKQAPAGMVRVTLTEWVDEVNKRAAKDKI